MNIQIQGNVIIAKDTENFDTERVISQIKAVAFNNNLRVVNGSDKWTDVSVDLNRSGFAKYDKRTIEVCTMQIA